MAASVAVMLLAAVMVSCGGGQATVATPLRTAPEPAVSPPASDRLPGTVLPLAGAPEGVAVIRSGATAVSVRDPNALVLFDLANPTARRTVAMSGSARHLFLGGPDGPLLVPQESDDRFVAVGPAQRPHPRLSPRRPPAA